MKRGKFQTINKFAEFHDGHIGRLINILIPYCNRQRRFFKSLPVAGCTRCNTHKRLIFCLAGLRKGLAVTSVDIFKQTFKRHVIDACPALSCIMDLNLPVTGPINQDVVDLLRIVLKWGIEVKMVFFRQSIQRCPREAPFLGARLPAHDDNRPLLDTERFVRNHQIFVEFHLVPQTKAFRTCTKGIIKGKASGLYFLDADSAVRTGKTLAELDWFLFENIDYHQTSGKFHDRFN